MESHVGDLKIESALASPHRRRSASAAMTNI